MNDGDGDGGVTEPGHRDPPGPGEPDGASLQDGVEHLKRAAHESIAAARALLEVVEKLLDDPRSTRTVLSGFDVLADLANRGKLYERHQPPDSSDGGEDDGGVQRIPVS